MNREILFRGKRSDNGEWIEGLTLQWGGDADPQHEKHLFLTPTGYSWPLEVDPFAVGQYTGLTDKNGRKIFEGDIIRYADEIIGKEKVDEVEYNETHAAFCRLHESEMRLQYLFIDETVANKCEVCGNSFDNPELVEVLDSRKENVNGV